MAKKIEKNTVTSESLEPAEVLSTPPEEVKELLKEESVETTVTLARPCYINGKQYGPGQTVVPTDAWYVWKNCL